MGRLAAEWYAESSHGISPRVHRWRPLPVGAPESDAHHDGAGVVTYYPGDFADLLYDVDREWE
jgi:hypothetical protein